MIDKISEKIAECQNLSSKHISLLLEKGNKYCIYHLIVDNKYSFTKEQKFMIIEMMVNSDFKNTVNYFFSFYSFSEEDLEYIIRNVWKVSDANVQAYSIMKNRLRRLVRNNGELLEIIDNL